MDNVQNVIAAVSQYEYEYLADDELAHLNQLTGDSYSPSTAAKYLHAYESGELSFFEEASEWGVDFTGLLPLYDSEGNRVAALCMDVEVKAIHTQLFLYTVETILIIVLLGVLFSSIFIDWTDTNIVTPILHLERSVVDLYAATVSAIPMRWCLRCRISTRTMRSSRSLMPSRK